MWKSCARIVRKGFKIGRIKLKSQLGEPPSKFYNVETGNENSLPKEDLHNNGLDFQWDDWVWIGTHLLKKREGGRRGVGGGIQASLHWNIPLE